MWEEGLNQYAKENGPCVNYDEKTMSSTKQVLLFTTLSIILGFLNA